MIKAVWIGMLVLVTSQGVWAGQERIKDLVQVQGVRNNQLIGYGLVVGLNGTGDQKSPFADQSISGLLNNFGINIPSGDLKTKNVAAVAVTATLPPFIKSGQTIDVSVSSLGNAKSLAGGTLLSTQLKGLDGQVYAIAQGALVVSGVSVSGKDGSNVTTNFPAGGHLPNGAIVERTVDTGFDVGNSMTLNLRNGDFTMAKMVADAINRKMGDDTARAIDSHSVEVMAPRMAHQKVAFLSEIENITVGNTMPSAKVIVNSRTGSVVVGQNVRIGPAAISHGKLTVIVKENGFSGDSDISVKEKSGPMFMFNAPTLNDILDQVNNVGAAPSDIVAIIQALKAAGALTAEVIII